METIKIILKGIGKILGFMIKSAPNLDTTLRSSDEGDYNPKSPTADNAGYIQ